MTQTQMFWKPNTRDNIFSVSQAKSNSDFKQVPYQHRERALNISSAYIIAQHSPPIPQIDGVKCVKSRAVQIRTIIEFENGGTNLGHLFHFAADQFSVAGALAVQMRTIIGGGNGGTNLGHLFQFAADQFSDAGALLSVQHMESADAKIAELIDLLNPKSSSPSL
ncbi:hypothetical protein LXL04_001068 [Taraxacum kok-saghyz]